MNFDYSDEQRELQAAARRTLTDSCPMSAVRAVLDGSAPYDAALWRQLGELGWIGAMIPEAYGGQGLDPVSYCGFLEEFGRSLAPVPLSSSIHLAAQAVLDEGTEAQKQAWLPRLASGAAIGCLALAEEVGVLAPEKIWTSFDEGALSGVKPVVSDGMAADLCVAVARDGATGEVGLYLVDMTAPGVSRTVLTSLDPTRPLAQIAFDKAPAERLDGGSGGWAAVARLLDRAAILTAFEQLGGADRCLDLACDYARLRHAFGRPIGSFQAIKHKLVDVYAANQIARSAAYYGAWALASGPEEIPRAAAVARIAAIQAYERASRDFIHVSGGIGNTWQYDAHLFYRRSRYLAVLLGAADPWRERLAGVLKADFIAGGTSIPAAA